MERGHCRVCLETEVKSGTSAKQKTIDLALLTARLAHPRQAAESRVQCAVDTRCSFCWRVSIFIYDIIAAAELPCPLGLTVLSFPSERKLVLMA